MSKTNNTDRVEDGYDAQPWALLNVACDHAGRCVFVPLAPCDDRGTPRLEWLSADLGRLRGCKAAA